MSLRARNIASQHCILGGGGTCEGDAPTCAYVTTSYRSDFTCNISSTNSNTATLMSTCSAYALRIPNLYILQRLPFPGSLRPPRGVRVVVAPAFESRKSEVEESRRKSEVESLKSKVRKQKSEVDSRKSEVGSRKSEVCHVAAIVAAPYFLRSCRSFRSKRLIFCVAAVAAG